MTLIGYALSVLLLGGSVGAFLYGVDMDVCVPVAAAGIALMLALELAAWRRRGRLGPGRMEAVCGACALLCGVPAYYSPDSVPALAFGVGGFLFFIFLSFAAQIWGKARETRALAARWVAHEDALPDHVHRERAARDRLRARRTAGL